MKHYSVLKQEAILALNIQEDSVIVDATIGYAGHSKEILPKLKKGYLYGFDQDMEAVEYATKTLEEISNSFHIFHTNFEHLEDRLKEIGVSNVDGILFDLGVSSPQIDSIKRGFSFMQDEILDMRMDQTNPKSALDVVNGYSYEDLVRIFFQYGEEKQSKLIAKKIISEREKKEIRSTLELVSLIERAVGANYFFKQHPERKIFQAIRIEVNEELRVLETVLPQAFRLLKVGGRVAVITFHSLEDRIVKNIFRKFSEVDERVKGLPEIPEAFQKNMQVITKKPILPSQEEINENSRSKSAKLRVIERIR